MFTVTQLFDKVTISADEMTTLRVTIEGFELHHEAAQELARALNAHFAKRNREINRAVQNQEGY